jgi:5-methylcytosine-specific restriction endonuclease McrBC GTP-binding regulatory subunit McrB
MNTADKSIALVDIALRRRFSFIPMYPDLLKLENVLKEKGMAKEEVNLRIEVLSILNRLIRSKKTVDFEIGHSYFMSLDKLENIMNDQVLTLLNEYFMYDLRVVKDLLEKQQFDKDKTKIPMIGMKFDPKEFTDRGLLKINSVYSLKGDIVIDLITEIESTEEV